MPPPLGRDPRRGEAVRGGQPGGGCQVVLPPLPHFGPVPDPQWELPGRRPQGALKEMEGGAQEAGL